MKCPHCGRENRVGAGFCAWCGGTLPVGRGTAVPPGEDTSVAPPSPEPAGAAGAEARPTPEPPGPAQEHPTDAGADDLPAWLVGVGTAGGEVPPASRAAEGQGADRGRAAEPPPEEEGELPAGRPTVKLPEPEGPAGSPEPTSAADDTAPLQPGTVIAERFEILELVESSPDHNRYRARDLTRCPACGHEGNAPGDAYCAECGASLQTPAYASILEQLRVPPEAYDAHFSEGRRDYYVRVEPPRDEAQPEEASASPLRLLWGRATDAGRQRDHNEDYLEGWLYTRASGGLVALFVVADGLGGQDSGEVASRMATDAAWASLRDTVWQPIIQGQELPAAVLEERVAEAARAANRVVYDERLARDSEMSTTLTMALIVDDAAYIANVGDSRTYLWNANGLQRITRDHSLVQRLVDAGHITADEVYTHPQRNLIYQSIGDRPEVQVDTSRRHLAADDRLILCSDGLWEMVHDDGLEEVLLSEPDPQRACDRLVQNANLAGGEDNISVIIIQVQGA